MSEEPQVVDEFARGMAQATAMALNCILKELSEQRGEIRDKALPNAPLQMHEMVSRLAVDKPRKWGDGADAARIVIALGLRF